MRWFGRGLRAVPRVGGGATLYSKDGYAGSLSKGTTQKPPTPAPDVATFARTGTFSSDDHVRTQGSALVSPALLEREINVAIAQHGPRVEGREHLYSAGCTLCWHGSVVPTREQAEKVAADHQAFVERTLRAATTLEELENAVTLLQWRGENRVAVYRYLTRMIPGMPSALTAREILQRYDLREGDRTYEESDRHFWKRKRTEAKDRGYYDSIAEDGVEEPIIVEYRDTDRDRKPVILDGHHRVAVMAKENPNQLVRILYGTRPHMDLD